MIRVTSIQCPRCGAPLPLASGATAILCAYCNASIRVDDVATGDPRGQPTLTMHAVATDVIERVKQLVLDGKRSEAIALYAAEVKLDRAAAEKAVDGMLLPLLFSMTRRAPLSTFGVFLASAMVAAGVAGLVGGILLAVDNTAFILLAVLGAVVVVSALWLFVPKAISTGVQLWGREGRATVLNRAILKPGFRKGGTLVVVVMQVEPAGGGASFVDEETMLVRDESLEKLAPGSIISVRFDGGRDRRVFATSPIEVVGHVQVER